MICILRAEETERLSRNAIDLLEYEYTIFGLFDTMTLSMHFHKASGLGGCITWIGLRIVPRPIIL